MAIEKYKSNGDLVHAQVVYSVGMDKAGIERMFERENDRIELFTRKCFEAGIDIPDEVTQHKAAIDAMRETWEQYTIW